MSIRQRLEAIVAIHASPDLMRSGFYDEYRSTILNVLEEKMEQSPRYVQDFILNSGYRLGFGDDVRFIEPGIGDNLQIYGAGGMFNPMEKTITSLLPVDWTRHGRSERPVLNTQGIDRALSTFYHEIGHAIDFHIGEDYQYFSVNNFISVERRFADMNTGLEAGIKNGGASVSDFDSLSVMKYQMQALSEKGLQNLYEGLPESLWRNTAKGNGGPLFHSISDIYVLDKNNKQAVNFENIDPVKSKLHESRESTAEMFKHYFLLKIQGGLSDEQIGQRFQSVSPELWDWFSSEVLPRANKLKLPDVPLEYIVNIQCGIYSKMMAWEAMEHGNDFFIGLEQARQNLSGFTPERLSLEIDMLRARRMERQGLYLTAREKDVLSLGEYFAHHGIDEDPGIFYDGLQKRTGKAQAYELTEFVNQTFKDVKGIDLYSLTPLASFSQPERLGEFIQTLYGFDITDPNIDPMDRLRGWMAVYEESDRAIAMFDAGHVKNFDEKFVEDFFQKRLAAFQGQQQLLPGQQQQARPAASPSQRAQQEMWAREQAEKQLQMSRPSSGDIDQPRPQDVAPVDMDALSQPQVPKLGSAFNASANDTLLIPDNVTAVDRLSVDVTNNPAELAREAKAARVEARGLKMTKLGLLAGVAVTGGIGALLHEAHATQRTVAEELRKGGVLSQEAYDEYIALNKEVEVIMQAENVAGQGWIFLASTPIVENDARIKFEEFSNKYGLSQDVHEMLGMSMFDGLSVQGKFAKDVTNFLQIEQKDCPPELQALWQANKDLYWATHRNTTRGIKEDVSTRAGAAADSYQAEFNKVLADPKRAQILLDNIPNETKLDIIALTAKYSDTDAYPEIKLLADMQAQLLNLGATPQGGFGARAPLLEEIDNLKSELLENDAMLDAYIMDYFKPVEYQYTPDLETQQGAAVQNSIQNHMTQPRV